jgi:methionyl-tRNA formyltransferase
MRTLQRVILMGKGELAINVGEWFRRSEQYELVCVVPVIPEPSWTDSLAGWARGQGLPVVASGHYRDIPDLQDPDWRIDLVFSVFYDRIIRPWFIEKAHRVLNLHNGPLPRYRGVCPINWALKNAERMHGVTIHQITPGIDDGPIFGQLMYSIYPECDEVVDVYRRALRYGYTLFEQTMPLLDLIQPQPQREAESTYYSKKDSIRLGERSGFTRAVSA